MKIVRKMAAEYGVTLLIAFDGNFRGMFEQVEYIRAEISPSDIGA